MKKYIDWVLDKLYSENTLAGIIFMALVLFFARLAFPERADKISNYLIPAFIFLNYFAALLLESHRVRSNVDNTDLAYINKRIEELEKPVGQGES